MYYCDLSADDYIRLDISVSALTKVDLVVAIPFCQQFHLNLFILYEMSVDIQSSSKIANQ